MSQSSYWPASGLLVPFPGPVDAPLASSGAQAVPTEYLTNLVRAGSLRTSNPDGSSVPAPVDYFQFAIYCSALTASIGVFGGQVIDVVGFSSVQDGGEGQFYWNPTSTTTADGGLVFGAAATGRWIRRTDAQSRRNVKWWGAKGDTATDDTAAIQLAINAATALKSEIFFPAGKYLISSTLVVAGSGLRFTGEAGSTTGDMGTYLQWNYTAATADDGGTRTLMQVTGQDVIFRHIVFYNSVNGDVNYRKKIAQNGVAIGVFSGQTFVATRGIVFEDCKFSGFRNGVILDRDGVSAGTLDFLKFVRCAWQTHDRCVYVHGGQPLGMNFLHCSFSGVDPTGGGREPYGTGFYLDSSSGCSVSWIGGTVTYIAAGFWCLYSTPISIYDVDSENTKQMVRLYDFGAAGGYAVNVEGGRFNFGVSGAGIGYMYNPSDDIAAGVHRYLEISGGAAVTLRGASFNIGYTPDTNFRVSVGGEVNLVSSGCLYPSTRPFERTVQIGQLAGAYSTPGSTFSQGDMGVQADPGLPSRPVAPCPALLGCENPGGTFTISGASTTATAITFDRSEPSLTSTLTNVAYRVVFTPVSFTGTPAVGSLSPYAASKSTTGFTPTVLVAPGVGNTVTFFYELVR
jgi:hypothetical protein